MTVWLLEVGHQFVPGTTTYQTHTVAADRPTAHLLLTDLADDYQRNVGDTPTVEGHARRGPYAVTFPAGGPSYRIRPRTVV